MKRKNISKRSSTYEHLISFKKKIKKCIFVVDIQFNVVCFEKSTVLFNSHVLSNVMLSSAVKFPAVKSKKREMLHQPKSI